MGFPSPGSVTDSSPASGSAVLPQGWCCWLSTPVSCASWVLRELIGLPQLLFPLCCSWGRKRGEKQAGSADGGSWAESRFLCLPSVLLSSAPHPSHSWMRSAPCTWALPLKIQARISMDCQASWEKASHICSLSRSNPACVSCFPCKN